MTEEIIIQDRRSNPFRIIFAFLIGGLIGTGIAFLLAPQSGQATRQMIKDKSIQLKDEAGARIEQKTNNLKQQVMNRGRELLDNQRSKVEAKVKQL